MFIRQVLLHPRTLRIRFKNRLGIKGRLLPRAHCICSTMPYIVALYLGKPRSDEQGTRSTCVSNKIYTRFSQRGTKTRRWVRVITLHTFFSGMIVCKHATRHFSRRRSTQPTPAMCPKFPPNFSSIVFSPGGNRLFRHPQEPRYHPRHPTR